MQTKHFIKQKSYHFVIFRFLLATLNIFVSVTGLPGFYCVPIEINGLEAANIVQ